eukprot:GHVP01020085.1.p1 GENE.GHVP01020085.1~~GHVP01020085.1.p1  ORF type:complete len:215 (+),score=30.68 GHVP01020085.1:53-697(+)
MHQASYFRLGAYKVGQTIGTGTFARVKVAEHEATKIKVAVKIVNKAKMKALDMETKIKREIQALKNLDHPHIVKFIELIDTPTDIFIVTEYALGGELFGLIAGNPRLEEKSVRKLFQQLICAVEHCHLKMICHRDLKPENVLLDANRNIKVVDFGLGNFLREGSFLRTPCGSINYTPPEVLWRQVYAGPEVDIWSCGVILYTMLTGKQKKLKLN